MSIRMDMHIIIFILCISKFMCVSYLSFSAKRMELYKSYFLFT